MIHTLAENIGIHGTQDLADLKKGLKKVDRDEMMNSDEK